MPARSLAVLALLVSGCAAPLTCPAKGGAPWTEVTSAHVVLRTDVEPDEAQAMATRFEALWGALAYAMRAPARAGGKIEVVRFHRRQDYFEINGHNATSYGYFSREHPGDVEERPTMVFQGRDLAVEDQETFVHELAHRFLPERIAAPPRWLSEGFATYYATLRIDGARIVLGDPGGYDFSERPFWWRSERPNGALTEQIPAYQAIKVWDLLNTDARTFYPATSSKSPVLLQRRQQAIHYAVAWKLVHYLLDGPNAEDRARFTAFLAAAERGERPRDAFLETFGADLPRLERSFHEYLAQPQVNRRVLGYALPAGAPPPIARPMNDAEVHLLWARLLLRTDRSSSAVLGHLDEALAADPRSPEVRRQRAVYFAQHARPDEANREVQAALALGSGDPRDLYVQLAVHRARAAAEKVAPPPADLVARLAASGTSASHLWLAAVFQREAGQADAALATADRALALDPRHWRSHRLRAQILSAAGRTIEALAAVDRAIAVLPEGTDAAPLVDLRAKIMSKSPPPAPSALPPP